MQRILLLPTSEQLLGYYYVAMTTWNRQGAILPGVTKEQAIRARVIYDSAYHPDTGDKMNVIGRMSAQVPCGMVLIGGMMVFYKYVIS